MISRPTIYIVLEERNKEMKMIEVDEKEDM